jgi:hypothetical protein
MPCPAAAAAGYTAGWLADSMPAACEGLSARACAACRALPTASISGCLKCAKAAAPTDMQILVNGIKTLTRAETCAACYGASAANADA